jgi:hypothetical protein
MATKLKLLVAVFLVLVFSPLTMKAQTEQFLASNYFSGHDPKEVTISARDGQVLSVINVPVGIMLSVHLVRGQFQGPRVNRESPPGLMATCRFALAKSAPAPS